jgi:glycosyltransferase involved in cell wall biosynthesis
VRVLVDYRSALKTRTGVGEYAHGLVGALVAAAAKSREPGIDVTIFSSSWKDRLSVPSDLNGVSAIDLRIPVSGLNFAWHRFGWPAVELLTRTQFDVAHSLHPLLLPSRAAAQVITIHDLNFLDHPDRTTAEIRRDYPSLARDHAQRADQIIAVSKFTASEVQARFGVPSERISVCSIGAPDWTPRTAPPSNGYVLFLGTLEPRKNVGSLLDAYARVLESRHGQDVPDLVLAGSAPPSAGPWLERLTRPPLAGHARHVGYVEPEDRESLYRGARLFVQPSFDEGFGIPVLEAMTVGVPVIAANRGALPEVLGDAGPLVNAADTEELAGAMRRLLTDDGFAEHCSAAGLARARLFRWDVMAERVAEAYRLAVAHRSARLNATCVSA